MADKAKDQPQAPREEKDDVRTADAGPPAPETFRQIADDVVPTHDAEQKAYLRALKTEKAQVADKALAERVEGTDAEDTPSGSALLEVVGTSNDTKRGEEYLRAKLRKRHGLD